MDGERKGGGRNGGRERREGERERGTIRQIGRERVREI